MKLYLPSDSSPRTDPSFTFPVDGETVEVCLFSCLYFFFLFYQLGDASRIVDSSRSFLRMPTVREEFDDAHEDDPIGSGAKRSRTATPGYKELRDVGTPCVSQCIAGTSGERAPGRTDGVGVGFGVGGSSFVAVGVKWRGLPAAFRWGYRGQAVSLSPLLRASLYLRSAARQGFNSPR